MTRATQQRTDEDIQADIAAQLRWDGRVEAGNVRVEVQDGEVTLHGTVASRTAEQAAVTNSYSVLGVRRVVNRMEVEPSGGEPVPPDDQLVHGAEHVIAWHPEIDEGRIRVTAQNGVVTLEGSVEAFWKKLLVEDLVANLHGVTRAINRLTVVPGKDVHDEAIGQELQSALARNSHMVDGHVEVKVENGHVTLSGTVPSWAASHVAYEAAACTNGVRDVKNNLAVSE